MSLEIFKIVLYSWLGLSAAAFVYLMFFSAPYGRHSRKGWGVEIGAKKAWMIMELPAVLTITVFFFLGDRLSNPVAIVFLGIWLFHYVNRTFVFPLRMSKTSRPMPAVVAVSGIFFNLGNGYLNGAWLFAISPEKSLSWFYDPRFIIGAIMFFAGFAINKHSDEVLRRLRKPGETGYKIPQGGLHKYVASPNYFGESVEWLGWAILTWSPAGLAFFIWTLANLLPRAISNRNWYREKFPDYPKSRKAFLPFVL